jgi:metal-responsive CopG/Arc/MetJ family transcriptional regulator
VSKSSSNRVVVSINDEMAIHLDALAELRFTSKSSLIRHALADFLNKPENASNVRNPEEVFLAELEAFAQQEISEEADEV